MCFSAPVSFITAAILGILWILIIIKAKTKEEFFLSLIPLLFALQQFAEGMIWIGNSFTQYFAYFFLVVAAVIWSSYVPFVIYLLERKTKNKKHQKWLKYLLITGIFLSMLLAISLILGTPQPQLLEEGIRYLNIFPLGNLGTIPLLEYLLLAIYVIVVVGSCWLSSLKIIRVLGWGLLIALLLSFALSFTTYGSRWCYFAAVLSGIIAAHFLIKDKKKKNKRQAQGKI
ncbi:hypothetical protein HYX12_02575 [Candidatus Woesearchaeota archaeon]|nr:hypothetical protein [Candidatus Woesearchaeota archaeon]